MLVQNSYVKLTSRGPASDLGQIKKKMNTPTEIFSVVGGSPIEAPPTDSATRPADSETPPALPLSAALQPSRQCEAAATRKAVLGAPPAPDDNTNTLAGAIEATAEKPVVKRKKKEKQTAKKWQDFNLHDDLSELLQMGGPGIDQEMVLGDNVGGTAKMTIAPMGKGDKPLIQVPRTGAQSYKAAMHYLFMHLIARFSRNGDNEVGDYQPAVDRSTGARRPDIPTDHFNFHTRKFCDNFICVGEGDFQTTVIEFFNAFGVTRNHTEHGKRISVSGASRTPLPGQTRPLKRGEGQLRWKVAAADVPRATIDFMLKVYTFGLTWDKKIKSIGLWEETEDIQNHLATLEITSAALIETIQNIREGRFRILEKDRTKDVPGTLDPEKLERVVNSNGHKLKESKNCGLNCVKWDVQGEEDVTVRCYNKILETVQQGVARKNDITCKVTKLLAPSTEGLTTKLYDRAYYENGLTRVEATFTFPEGEAWTLDEMDSELDKAHALLEKCLVSASIHEHLAGMEQCLTRSIVVYCPLAFKWKRHRQLGIKAKDKDESYKTDYPDGVVMRYKNKHSLKVNGEEAHGRISGRKHEVDKYGWDAVARVAAACCHSGQDPRLFVVVGGTERFFDGGAGPVHFYLREVPLQRFAVAPSMLLQTAFIGDKKNAFEEIAEWSQINVRPHELRLNPRILPRSVVKNARTPDLPIQIELAIPDAFSPADLLDVDDASEEEITAFTGKQPGVCAPSEWNMPSVASQWELLKNQTVGRHKTDKLKFKWKGSWFWLPKKDQAEIRAKVFGKEGVTCTFQWRDNAFYCIISEIDDTSAPLASASLPMQGADLPGVKTTLLGPKRSRFDIPVTGNKIKDGNTINDAGLKGETDTCFVDLSQGMFCIPQSLSVKLLALAEGKGTPRDLSFLRGCKLIRPDSERMRVRDQSNDEPYVWIITAADEVLVKQDFTKPCAKAKRQRELLGAAQADEGPDQVTTQADEGPDQVTTQADEGPDQFTTQADEGPDQVMGTETTQADQGAGGGEPEAKRQRVA